MDYAAKNLLAAFISALLGKRVKAEEVHQVVKENPRITKAIKSQVDSLSS